MIQAPKGTKDKFGEEVFAWKQLEAVIRKLCDDFCVEEIRTPTFEYTDLFQRGVGQTTDIVQKEMFSFTDRGGRNYSLRPESTASVARAYIQNGMSSNAQPTKVYYIANSFRAERPQKGRYLEFSQFGVEIIGSYNPASDAEAICIAHELLRRLNIKNVNLHLNSLGDIESRNNFNITLKQYINNNIDKLCPTCKDRVEKNPLRVLDCKNKNCQDILNDAPSTLKSLNDESKKHFQDVQDYLTAMGISFIVNDKIVRGLDYYTNTVFEFVSNDLGSQNTVCGGGRYNNLIEEVGGKPEGACGFSFGLERLLLILEEQGNKPIYKRTTDIFIGSIGNQGARKAQNIIYDLRKRGISAEFDSLGRSVKAQLKYANKIGAKYSLIIGDNEVESNMVSIKDMITGEQTKVLFSNIFDFLSK